jgi:HD-GYP domain-containing protein (c-di-GMP phosphodiesterase class II)
MVGGVSKEDVNKIIDTALSHQEHFDGTGYPRDLKGEEIPLGGRIAALVDSFEAMAAGRKYQPSNTFQQAVEIVTKELGLQFDSKIGESFLNAVKNEKRKKWNAARCSSQAP